MADVQTEEFKPSEFMATRNAADAAKRAGKEPDPVMLAKPEEKPVTVAEPEDDDKDVEFHTPKLPRSVRRELNKLREEAAEARGRLAAFQEFQSKNQTKHDETSKDDTKSDPEPQRKDFADDAQYNRALGRWDARQEAAKLLEGKDTKEEAKRQEQAWIDGVKEMDAKAVEDQKLIPDFAEVATAAVEAAEEDESLRFSPAEQPTFFALLMQSDVRAFMYHHFAKNPDDLRKILGMKPVQQIPFFNRIEGRVEKMYSTEEPKKEAAQASADKPAKDRQDPANGATPGRTAAASDKRPQPRPSTEVAARGGSAPPEEPAVGSPAWMRRRNQAQFGR